MKRLLTIFTLTVFLAILTGTASAVTIISDTDFGNSTLVGKTNGTYVPGSPGYMHLAYTGPNDTAVVGAKGPFGTLNNISMSFNYSNLLGDNGNGPYAAFGVSENSLWNGSAPEFLIIALGGNQLNGATLVHVWDEQTNAEYLPTLWGSTLASILGITPSDGTMAFGNMEVMRAYAYLGAGTGSGVVVGSVDINSITVNSSVPEPATMLLLGLGLVGLAGIRRKLRS